MAAIQVFMEISETAALGLEAGTMIRHGGVIYNAVGGGIVEHLKDVAPPSEVKEVAVSAAQSTKSAFTNITKNLKNPMVLIAIGLGAIAVGGVIYYVTDKNKKKDKQSLLPEVPKCVVDYNEAVISYLDAIRNGNVSLHNINAIIENIDIMKSDDNIKFDYSKENSETLLGYVYEYTEKLAKANSFEPVGLEKPNSYSADETLKYFRSCLEIQKQIFEEAA